MKTVVSLCVIALSLFVPQITTGAEELFRDEFKNQLGQGWSWVREDAANWHVSTNGLEIRPRPGNLWGPPNDAHNVLVRPITPPTNAALEISVVVENHPTSQYEQANLAWYYDDSHMVKLGLELVDEKLCIVMGREERDRAQTVALLPSSANRVQLRLTVRDNSIRGDYRLGDETHWRKAGQCTLPRHGAPQISLQVYQGTETTAHWARFRDFIIRRD